MAARSNGVTQIRRGDYTATTPARAISSVINGFSSTCSPHSTGTWAGSSEWRWGWWWKSVPRSHVCVNHVGFISTRLIRSMEKLTRCLATVAVTIGWDRGCKPAIGSGDEKSHPQSNLPRATRHLQRLFVTPTVLLLWYKKKVTIHPSSSQFAIFICWV